MRLRACLALTLLGLSACQSLPSAMLIDVDGSTLQFRKKEPQVPPAVDTAANQVADDDGPR